MISNEMSKFLANLIRSLPLNMHEEVLKAWNEHPDFIAEVSREFSRRAPLKFQYFGPVEFDIGSKTSEDYINQIKNDSDYYFFLSHAEDMLRNLIVTEEKYKLTTNLAVVSARMLGFTLEYQFSLSEFYKSVTSRYDFELCPAEIGPKFLLRYGTKIHDKTQFCIAMEPILDSVFIISGADRGTRSTFAGSIPFHGMDNFLFIARSQRAKLHLKS